MRSSAFHYWEVAKSIAVIFEPPMHVILPLCCWLLAMCATWRGARWLVKGLREADRPSGVLWVVRGIRGVIVAVRLAVWAGGALLASPGLLVLGAIFLGEELHEIGVVLLAL